MKKALSLILAILTAFQILTLTSCEKTDIDLLEKENVYADLVTIIQSPAEYHGKTVTFTSTCTAVYDFSQNKIIRHTISQFDETGTKRVLYEVRKSDGKYPRVGSEVTLVGKINSEGYITVSSFEASQEVKKQDFENLEPSFNGVKKFFNAFFTPYSVSEEYDYDTLELSSVELNKFINDYRTQYENHEYYGKTIRIFGHLAQNDSGYTYLIGLDSNGKYLWDIELYDPDGKFEYPTAEGNTVNPVEIIGELSTYYEKDVLYSCITVKQVGRCESVFKENKIDEGFVMP